MTRIPQLDEAVKHALRAPSVHNTQPWRWHIDTADGVVELYADQGRRLSATDPDGRDLLISCGAALDHLVVTLAHAGLQATTLRFPDPENSAHLATVQVSGTRDAEAADGIPSPRSHRRRPGCPVRPGSCWASPTNPSSCCGSAGPQPVPRSSWTRPGAISRPS